MRIDDRIRHETLNQRINSKGPTRNAGVAYENNGLAYNDLYALKDLSDARTKPSEEAYLSSVGADLPDMYDKDTSRSDTRIRNIRRGNTKEARNYAKDWNAKNPGVQIYENFHGAKRYGGIKHYDQYVDNIAPFDIKFSVNKLSSNDVKSFTKKLKEAASAADYANSLLKKYL